MLFYKMIATGDNKVSEDRRQEDYRKIFELAARVPVMLLGEPGIGKTAAVTKFARDIGADCIDICLSAEMSNSFEGRDYVCPKKSRLKTEKAWWLQRIEKNREKNIPTVLFFKEYTNAEDTLQRLAYSPFVERKWQGVSFDYSLERPRGAYSGFLKPRPGLYVFGAGRRIEDETGTKEILYALRTHVFAVDFEVSPAEGMRCAEHSNIHPKIRAFIYTTPDALLEKSSAGNACPREWENLSVAIQLGVPYREAAHGTIRGEYEEKFCAFYEQSDLYPTIEEIINGRAQKPAAHLTVFCAVLVIALTEHRQAIKYFPTVYRWIAEQCPECEIVFAQYAIDLLSQKLVSDKECMTLLYSAVRKQEYV